MIGLHHENLTPVVATCLDSQLRYPAKLVYLASSDDDNLRLFLQRCRHTQVGSFRLFTRHLPRG